MTRIEGGSCEFCNQPLQIRTDAAGKKYFICSNIKCPTQRLTQIEARLEAIEKILEIKSLNKEGTISLKPETEGESIVIQHIRTLPNLSIEEGKHRYYSLINQLNGFREKLNLLLERTANDEYAAPRFLQEWTILMAYSGKAFIAAQRILKEKGHSESHFSQASINNYISVIIGRSNSVLKDEQHKIIPTQFYSHLLNWATNEGFSKKTLKNLEGKAKIISPIIQERLPEEISSPSLVPDIEITPSPIKRPIEQPSSKGWINRFRPQEGWEFTIGANWLRWVGIGIILFALFLLVVWSSSQMKLTEKEIAFLTFTGFFLSGITLHIFSFVLLRFKERSRYIPSISSSLAFLSIGIFYIALFVLRFHHSSPVYGIENERIYLILCLLLILICCFTAWGHNSNIIFIEGFSVSLWLFWHISSQILVNHLIFSVNILWIGYVVCIFAFLGIGYLRKDILLVISIQLMVLILIFLPNSSKIFSTYSILGGYPEINVTIVLMFIITIFYWVIAFRFPLDITPQFYEILNRNHLSISSVTPIFASFFLLTFRSITGIVFILYLVIFTTLFLGLAYYQKDLGVAFSLIFLTQLLWLVSVGFMDNITFIESIPAINGIIIILLFLTFAFWIIAHKFPSDEIEILFGDYISRKHLSIAAIGPLFISFILCLFNFITMNIFVMYLVLFCILWSTNRSFTLEISDLPIQNISLFDIVVYSSAILFLITILLEYNEDMFGVILGFIAFPLLIILNQTLSSMSIHEQEIQKIYPIVNSLFIAIIFSFMTLKDTFSQLGLWTLRIFNEWEILNLKYDQTWAFIGYLWVVVVAIINITIFKTHITNILSKIMMVLSSTTIIYVYFSLIDNFSLIHLLFISVGYIHLIIYWIFFTSEIEIKKHPTRDEHLVFIPSIALLQLTGSYFFTTSATSLNDFLPFIVNLLLPFSIGILMILRGYFHHFIDSYLVISTSIFTITQYFYLKVNQQADVWILGLIFITSSLIYIFIRLYFGKKHLKSTSTSPSFLRFFYPALTYSNKEEIGVNLLLLCFLGLINNYLCFIFFPTGWSSVIIFLILDLITILPMVFALTLFGIDSHVATANALTVYSGGLILRLPFLTNYTFDFDIYLLIGIFIQLILHVYLVRLSKFMKLKNSLFVNWKFEFGGRKTWLQDSLRIMAIINPFVFYLCASQLTSRIAGIFKISNVLPMMILSVIIAIYFVIKTRFTLPSIISDSGLLISIIITWLFTISLLEFIYFTTAITAFLSILYGFWVNRREWRIFGMIIIAVSLLYSAIYLAQIPDNLVKILGFGILGIISVVIAFVYSKFAKRFIEGEFQKMDAQKKISSS
ncbi:MAG: hypothetical protein ACFFFH_03125 [Candidatus Thorarchaeota archaeon]